MGFNSKQMTRCCSNHLVQRPNSVTKVNLLERQIVTNFIQLVSPQPVELFSQTKLHCKAPNKGYLHICGMYKSNNKQLRYQIISNCKIFVCQYLMNDWTDLHNQTCIGKYSSNHFQLYMVYYIAISIGRDTSISM